MATIAVKPYSSLSAAFAPGKHGIPSPPSPDVAYAPVVKTTEMGHGTGLPLDLPTPPNSMSPEFQPDGRAHRTPSLAVDSDVDLQDAAEAARAQGQPTALSSAALSGLEASAAITPSLIAKHHLPDILLPNGPLAIRYILNYLTQSVPGFSGIAPQKARRLVVSALEMRGGGGVNGDVEFEKVGWGRWDARIRGQPPREGHSTVQPGSFPVSERARSGISPSESVAESYAMSNAGLQIPKGSRRQRRDQIAGSWVESVHDLEIDMSMNVAEHEADKMSLDGSESDTSSSAAEGTPVLEDDMDGGDVTDEEDWAGISPDALRFAHSYGSARHNGNRTRVSTSRMRSSNAGLGHAKLMPRPRLASHDHRAHSYQNTHPRAQATERRASSAMHVQKATNARSYSTAGLQMSSLRGGAGIKLDHTNLGMVNDSQERDAIEALLKMGSM